MIYLAASATLAAWAVSLLYVFGRHADEGGPHGALGTVASGLGSFFILVSSFAIVTGWVAQTEGRVAHVPTLLSFANLASAVGLAAYPAMAGLPWTRRSAALIGWWAALVGLFLAMAWEYTH